MVVYLMNYILADLEWNGAPLYKSGGYFNEIIEIGAVKLNESFEIIDTFQTMVRPSVHKKLTGRIKRLTHISNDEVRAAKAFPETYRRFVEWADGEESCLLTWGVGDLLVILENLRRFSLPEKLEITRYYCDAQAMCQQVLGIEKAKQPGLSAVAEQIGIPCDDMEMHRALDDSRVTAQCFARLWNRELFEKLMCPADSEFIRRITFKTVTLCDIDNPLIDRSLFSVRCPECGAPLTQTSEIIMRNRYFNVQYRCEACERDYFGRHQFRLRYEGVQHKCTLREQSEQQPEQAIDAQDADATGGEAVSQEQ